MAVGKTEGTMKIERIGRTWVGELLDRMGVFLRIIAPGFLWFYLWRVVVDEGGYNLTYLSAISAGALGFLIYALHTCFLSRLVFRPAIMLSLLGLEKHHWINDGQRRLAKQAGAKVLLLELASQRWRRRISESPEVKAVQKGLDRRCRLGSFLYCSGYVFFFVGLFAYCPQLTALGEANSAAHMIVFGCVLLFFAIISGYFTMQTDLWAAATYPQGKMTKIKTVAARAAKPKATIAQEDSKPKTTKRASKSPKTRRKTR